MEGIVKVLGVLVGALRRGDQETVDKVLSGELKITLQRAIAEDREPAASGSHGLKLVQLTEAMVESAKTGRTIKLEPTP